MGGCACTDVVQRGGREVGYDEPACLFLVRFEEEAFTWFCAYRGAKRSVHDASSPIFVLRTEGEGREAVYLCVFGSSPAFPMLNATGVAGGV